MGLVRLSRLLRWSSPSVSVPRRGPIPITETGTAGAVIIGTAGMAAPIGRVGPTATGTAGTAVRLRRDGAAVSSAAGAAVRTRRAGTGTSAGARHDGWKAAMRLGAAPGRRHHSGRPRGAGLGGPRNPVHAYQVGSGTTLTGKVFSGHSGFPRGFGYTNTVTPPGQGNLRAYSPCTTTPKPRRCR